MELIDRLAVESFKGTLAFARLLILMLFIASVMVDSGIGVCASIIVAAASYVSQHFFTINENRNGYVFQAVAVVAGIIAFIALMLAPH